MLRPLAKIALVGTLAAFSTFAFAAGPFDGIYRGSQTTIRATNNGLCGSLDKPDIALTITDSHFTRSWGAAGQLNVEVAPNGTFSSSSMVTTDRRPRTLTMTGTISGGVLSAELGTDLCAVHLSLKKS